MKLKPCPFCGYSDTRIEIEKDDLGHIAAVSCEICGATVHGVGVMVGPFTDDELRATASAAWNKRTPPRED